MQRSIGWAAVVLLCLSGCTSPDQEMLVDLDTFEGLASALEGEADVLVYDVRTNEEYQSGHIPGARNVPYDVIGKRLPFWRKKRTIVVYCLSGGRSARAYDTLVERGFTNVTDFGGIGNWQGELIEGKKRK